jgi:hypothetical protein
MAKNKPLIQKLFRIYDKTKNWLVGVSLLLIIIFWYFGDYFGELRNVILPAAVFGVVAILFDTLRNLELGLNRTKDKHVFPTISDSINILSDLSNRSNVL